MNILNALKQLRDDIKAWVTVNLNALNAKIDEKTIPIDSELSSTSTNPVQNKAIAKEIDSINNRVGDTSVATQISNAIDKVPTFSSDYNDLTNAPDISEDDSGNMVIADESGNIIFKADADGMHTTAVSINGEAAATEKYVDDAIANIEFPTTDLTDYATKKYVDDAVDSVDFTGYATETYVDTKVADLVNSAPEALNTLGELATALENHEDAYDALLETVGSKATHTDLENLKEELSESIVSEADEWKVVDENGNIIFSVDAGGAHTTSLTLNGQSVKDMIDDKVDKVDGKGLSTNDFTNEYKNKLDNLDDIVVEESDPTVPAWAKEASKPTYTADEVGALADTTVLADLTDDAEHRTVTDTEKNTWNAKSDFSGDYNDLENAPNITEDDTGNLVISDPNGNIIFRSDANGFETTQLTTNVLVVNGANIEDTITALNENTQTYIRDISVNQEDSSITITKGDSTTSVVKQPKKAISLFSNGSPTITNAGYGQFCFSSTSYTPYVYAPVVQYEITGYDGYGISISSTTNISSDLATSYLHYIIDNDSNVVYSINGTTAPTAVECDFRVNTTNMTTRYIPFTSSNTWAEYNSTHSYTLCLMAWKEISLPAAESASF